LLQQIPQPASLADYDRQSNLGNSVFSSWAYNVELCRISNGFRMPYTAAFEAKKKDELLARADALVCDWLVKVPKWKMDIVNSEGVVDMVLFHGIAFAHQ
jgi:hypothetical protein